MSFEDFSKHFTHLDLVHIGPDDWMNEPALHSKKPWRAVLARRRWRAGYNAGGGPTCLGQLPTSVASRHSKWRSYNGACFDRRNDGHESAVLRPDPAHHGVELQVPRRRLGDAALRDPRRRLPGEAQASRRGRLRLRHVERQPFNARHRLCRVRSAAQRHPAHRSFRYRTRKRRPATFPLAALSE